MKAVVVKNLEEGGYALNLTSDDRDELTTDFRSLDALLR